MSGINRDEWLKALQDAGLHDDSDDEALTRNEFAQLFGFTETTATRRLRDLVAAGKAIETTKRHRDGRGAVIVSKAYRLVEGR